jgi:hypothetical protein
MTDPTVENITETPVVPPTVSSNTTASSDSGNTAAPSDSASAAASSASDISAAAALKDLSKAYQDLATRNAANLRSSVQALIAVKSASEFIEVEKRLIKEGVQAAVSDSQNIAHLTAVAFTAAFAPVKQRIDALQKSARH